LFTFARQVTSQTAVDQVMDTGQKVQSGGVVGYRFVAPDKLRAFVDDYDIAMPLGDLLPGGGRPAGVGAEGRAPCPARW